jgi:hypothetical protein
MSGLFPGDDVLELEPPRASLGQLQLTNRLEMVRIDADVLGVAEALRRIDPGLTLLFDKGQAVFVLYWRGLRGGDVVEELVGAYTELDQRIVRLIERIDAQGRGRYDLATELDRLEAAQDREHDHAVSEQLGAAGEELQFAMRRDLGLTSSASFYRPDGSKVTAPLQRHPREP